MSRKYRQQGYQDSDKDSSRSDRRPQPRQQLSREEKIQRRSLRHATAREANEVVRCHACGRNNQNLGTIGPESACPNCSSPLHCCRACKHFDSGARWQCRAEIKQAVSDKGKANTCAQYAPRIVLDATGRRSNTAQGPTGPKAAFENLFKR